MPESVQDRRDQLDVLFGAQDLEGLLWWLVKRHRNALATGQKAPRMPGGVFVRSLEMLLQLEKRKPAETPVERDEHAEKVAELENVLRLLK